MVRILSRSDVLAVISMPEVIEAVERAFADLARGSGNQPERIPATIPSSDGLLIPMTATLARSDAGGVKLLADLPANPARNLPRQQSTITMVDTGTGRCEAVLDGGAITQYRTAAASAVATRQLARQDSRVLGLVGAGKQARVHMTAISEVRPIDTVLVWSRNESTSVAFRNEMAGHGTDIRIADSPEQVVRSADILCTLTPSPTPVVHGEWFTPGTHINAVGAPPRPDHREIDTEAIGRARIVVDDAHVALTESGAALIALREGAITADDLRTELGDVLIGAQPGRRSDDEITLFNSVGVPIQDIATASLVLGPAREQDLGIEVALSD
ncbi:MAG: ornithine cyclodeaminase family protein [Rubrobacteraceae bacterium]